MRSSTLVERESGRQLSIVPVSADDDKYSFVTDDVIYIYAVCVIRYKYYL